MKKKIDTDNAGSTRMVISEEENTEDIFGQEMTKNNTVTCEKENNTMGKNNFPSSRHHTGCRE